MIAQFIRRIEKLVHLVCAFIRIINRVEFWVAITEKNTKVHGNALYKWTSDLIRWHLTEYLVFLPSQYSSDQKICVMSSQDSRFQVSRRVKSTLMSNVIWLNSKAQINVLTEVMLRHSTTGSPHRVIRAIQSTCCYNKLLKLKSFQNRQLIQKSNFRLWIFCFSSEYYLAIFRHFNMPW